MPDARILITGSRSWSNSELLADVLLDTWHDATQLGYDRIVIVHGTADGADTLADLWARGHGLDVETHPADWQHCGPDCPPGHRKTNRRGTDYCPTAGHRRNQKMVGAGADLVVAFPKGPATGTRDCMRRAEKAGLTVRAIDV
ncbi:DUF2493 domain-containing protein [Streptomyces angustmyceticus]|uniref:DUF2493 domain-containing protein n=1 Tax=Streptomyces angustmyceticus TaxID=285578 RepID=UPI00344B7C84